MLELYKYIISQNIIKFNDRDITAMLFNSYIYLFLFLPIAHIIYFFLNKKRIIVGAKAWLVFASLFFYSYWKLSYLAIILASILFNYVIGYAISAKNEGQKIKFHRKSLLTFGIIVNVSALCYFKYMDFFIENINIYTSTNFNLLNIILPLAISFFTFQQIAYLVDSYKGTKEYDFLSYCLFVTFFPQLIAGPIVHHSEMMPQFNEVKNKVLNWKNIYYGLVILALGLFKKIGIADYIAQYANNGFTNAGDLSLIEGWITSLSYTIQLYFDFSGYTDMAIGSALIFNINLPVNFNSPYKAKDIQDFWRRWHMTLSRWLKDYLYIPLGGNRKGKTRTYINLFLTFLIGGFWHGAGWTFIIWGALHGIAIAIHRMWKEIGLKMNSILAWFVTFNFVNITWVFFRAKTATEALDVLKAMFGFNGVILPKYLAFIKGIFTEIQISSWSSNVIKEEIVRDKHITELFTYILLILIFTVLHPNIAQIKHKLNHKKWLYITPLVFVFCVFMFNRVSEFIYFNF